MSQIVPYKPGMTLTGGFLNTYRVYYLKNPATDEIFYIGITTKPLKDRLNGHMSFKKKNPSKKDIYIADLVAAGHRPLIEEIEVLPSRCFAHKIYAFHREQFWIRHYKQLNDALTNGTGYTGKTEYDFYRDKIESGQTEWGYYFCGETDDGIKIYDIEHLNKDGFQLAVAPPKPPSYPSYNPFENQRFLEKIVKGGAPASFDYVWLDYTAYKDDDPDWYEQDNCTLFGY